MTPHAAAIPADLPCHGCGYDLRAHPPDGQCPECGASVAESRRLAAVQLRPPWRDSDPRWRRRVLAGAWMLVLLPLVDALRASGWASSVPVPTVFGSRGTVNTLQDTLLCFPGVYPALAFCIGVVLLFANERGRRRGRLDWTRRWGVLCCYVVLLLSATQFLYVAALVSVGIAAVFQSMPLAYQPGVTRSLVDWGTAYLRYGPNPQNAAGVVLVASSSIAILLACIPLVDALRSSGPKRLAAIVLAPLALFALIYLAQAARYFAAFGLSPVADLLPYGVYFRPELLAGQPATRLSGQSPWASEPVAFTTEAVKWCAVVAIAAWLSIAQLGAWRRHKVVRPLLPLPCTLGRGPG
jgi:hypothetical protein